MWRSPNVPPSHVQPTPQTNVTGFGPRVSVRSPPRPTSTSTSTMLGLGLGSTPPPPTSMSFVSSPNTANYQLTDTGYITGQLGGLSLTQNSSSEGGSTTMSPTAGISINTGNSTQPQPLRQSTISSTGSTSSGGLVPAFSRSGIGLSGQSGLRLGQLNTGLSTGGVQLGSSSSSSQFTSYGVPISFNNPGIGCQVTSSPVQIGPASFRFSPFPTTSSSALAPGDSDSPSINVSGLRSGASTSPRKNFKEADLEKLRMLSKLIGQLHLNVSECRRIQRGPPGAGSLSMSMTQSRTNFNKLKPDIDDILNKYPTLPSIAKVKSQLNQCDVVLNEDINERGYDDGYTDRVKYLERMNYECGQLKGMLDLILEGLWASGGPGGGSGGGGSAVVKMLTFNDEEEEELLGIKLEEDLEAVLSTDPNYQSGDINIDVTLTTTFCSNLVCLMDDDDNTDVTFCIGSKRVYAHRIILAAQSEYFKSLLLGSMKEAEPNSEIPLDDVSLATFQLLIRFAYSGRVQLNNISLSGVVKLLEAADRFSFLGLRDGLVKQLSLLISLKTVIPLFLSAYSLNLSGLQKTCLEVTDKYAETLIKSEALLTLPAELLAHVLNRDTFVVDESLIYDAVQRWKAKNDSCPTTLIQCIRLTEMSEQKLVDLSEEEKGLFSDSQVLKALKVKVKPCWELRNPRGRKELMKNFFQFLDCAKVDGSVYWKSSSSNQSSNHGGGIKITDNIMYQGVPNVPLSNAIITSQQYQQSREGLFGSSRHSSYGSSVSQKLNVILALNDVYLVNEFVFNPFPNEEGLENLGFMYKLAVSVDKAEWKTLLDYSKHICYGQQRIPLPVIPVKYFRFNLCGVAAQVTVPFTVCFKECSLKTTRGLCSVPIIIRNNGIQVPREFMKCDSSLRYESWVFSKDTGHICNIKLKRPILARHIKIKLLGPSVEDNAVGDVTMHVNGEKRQTFKDITIKSKTIVLTLSEETPVSTISVEILRILFYGLSTTLDQQNYSISELWLKSDL